MRNDTVKITQNIEQTMKHRSSDLKVAVVLFLLLMILIPSSGIVQAQESYSIDDALLLMLAAQNRLYGDDDVEITALVANKTAKLIPLDISSQEDNTGQPNEHAQLQEYYQQWYEKLPHPDSPMGQYLIERAQWEGEQAEKLKQARIDAEELESAPSNPRRRNIFRRIGIGIGRGIRFVARPVGWVAGRTLHGAGKVGKVAIRIARDEIIGRARQIVRQKLRELGDIIQGRFDMFWEHVARQVGVPVAVLLREMVVDPLYLRVRDRFQGWGEQIAQTTTEDDGGSSDVGTDSDDMGKPDTEPGSDDTSDVEMFVLPTSGTRTYICETPHNVCVNIAEGESEYIPLAVDFSTGTYALEIDIICERDYMFGTGLWVITGSGNGTIDNEGLLLGEQQAHIEKYDDVEANFLDSEWDTGYFDFGIMSNDLANIYFSYQPFDADSSFITEREQQWSGGRQGLLEVWPEILFGTYPWLFTCESVD